MARRHQGYRAFENRPIAHGHLHLRIAMAIEPCRQKRSFAFKQAGEPCHACSAVGGLPTQLRAIRYQLVREVPGATSRTVVPQSPLDLSAAPGAHQGGEGSHHARSGLALDGGHIRGFVMGLPWPGRDYGTPNELPNANNNVAVCHRQSDRGAAWRRRRTCKE
jgi:hypothetical protein